MNRNYWNVVKGLGIFFIVLGHCFPPVQSFVYLFHVPLFFFISGYMFSDEKYGLHPVLNLKNRVKNNWLKYICVYVVFILSHNFFWRMNMLTSFSQPYSVKDTIGKILYMLIGSGDELLCSPLWFVPVLVFGSGLFGFIVFFSHFWKKYEIVIQILIIIVLSLAGLWLIQNHEPLIANFQIAMAVQPYFWLGYVLRNHNIEWRRFLTVFGFCGCVLILFIYSRNHFYSLVNAMVSPMMYITATMGIYCCLFLGKVIVDKSKRITDFFQILGYNSFWIMAIHYVVIRTIDRIYTGVTNTVDQMYVSYLGMNNYLLPIYLLLGIGVPLVIAKIVTGMERKVYESL